MKPSLRVKPIFRGDKSFTCVLRRTYAEKTSQYIVYLLSVGLVLQGLRLLRMHMNVSFCRQRSCKRRSIISLEFSFILHTAFKLDGAWLHPTIVIDTGLAFSSIELDPATLGNRITENAI